MFSPKAAKRKHLYIGFALSCKLFSSLVSAENKKRFVFLCVTMLDFFSYQLGEKFKLVGRFFLGEFYNISYQLAIDLIQFSPEEHQGSKGFGMVGYLV